MLYVDRGHHVDARIQQLQHVLIALAVSRSRHVGVRQLIYQAGVRVPGKNGVQIHFFQNHGAVRDGTPGNDLEISYLVLGVLSAVGLDQPNDHVDALLLHQVGIFQHLVGFAHAGRGPEVDP